MDNGDNPIVRFRLGYTLWMIAMFGGASWTMVWTAFARAART